MSKGLKGEYNHSVDAKGRMIVPSKLRDALGSSFVITRGMDPCLLAYPNDEWELFEEKLNQLPRTNKKARDLKRYFVGSAVDCEIDSQGRILLPSNLREFAKILKDVVIVGMVENVEIWSKEEYDAKKKEEPDFDELATGIEELGFMI